MTGLALAAATIVALALAGVVIVGFTFRAARAVRAARPRSAQEWVIDAMPPGSTVRSLGANGFEAEGTAGTTRFRVTWSPSSTVVQGWGQGRTHKIVAENPPTRGLRAKLNRIEALLAIP